ncbi:MAG: hypothetical protein H0W30_20355 [Gemmatimonadaceae bacterium]|nr:hypothetical protein [Gemmatimonadaceae bacterium]MDQ3520595.1 arrestin family protein [Gemmatimonadota bacterium]
MRRLLFLPFVVICGHSCKEATDPATEVAFTVTLDRTSAAPGESVRITVMAMNISSRPISLGGDCIPVGFRVYDATGLRVGPAVGWEASFACYDEIDNRIAPGGRRNYGFFWSPIVNYGVATTAVPIPPGIYTILGGLREGEGLRPVSEPVLFEVLAP